MAGLFNPKSNVERIFGTKHPTPEQIRDYEKRRKDVVMHDKLDGVSKEPIDASGEEPAVEFNSLEQIDGQFKQGQFKWPKVMKVGGFKYTYLKSHSKGIIDLFLNDKPGYIVYQSPENKAKLKESGLKQWMVFTFKASNMSSIAPLGISFFSAAQGRVIYEKNENIIGDVALLKMFLPTGVVTLKGRVDTGAEMSSLHIDGKPQVVGDMVRFNNHNASGNTIAAPLVTQQAVKSSDGGTEYRPVIELDVEINGKRVSKAQFNLNDRSNMEHQILIGQNILEKTGFLVDPSHDGTTVNMEMESLEYLNEDQIDRVIAGEDIENKKDGDLSLAILEMMFYNDLTFDDLLVHLEDNEEK